MDTIEARIRAINRSVVVRDRIDEPTLKRIISAIRQFRPGKEGRLQEMIAEAYIAAKQGDDIIEHLRQLQIWNLNLEKDYHRRCPDNFVVADEPPEKPILTMDDAFDNVPDEFVRFDEFTCPGCGERYPEYYRNCETAPGDCNGLEIKNGWHADDRKDGTGAKGLCLDCRLAGDFSREDRLRLVSDMLAWLKRCNYLTFRQFVTCRHWLLRGATQKEIAEFQAVTQQAVSKQLVAFRKKIYGKLPKGVVRMCLYCVWGEAFLKLLQDCKPPDWPRSGSRIPISELDNDDSDDFDS